MLDPSASQTEGKEVDSNTVYREMYTEMRRFRDYEFGGSTWYNAFLTAMLAGIIASRWGGGSGKLRLLLEWNVPFKIAVSLLAAVTGAVACYFVWYCRSRYKELRKWMDGMEPSWKQFKPKEYDIQPHGILLLTPLVLAGLVIAIALL